MEQYILKSALVAEIEKLVDKGKYHEEYDCTYRDGNNDALYALKEKVNSLEVKEVDLDSNIRTYLTNHFNIYEDGVLQSKKSGLPLRTYDIIKVAKHFFELGMRASNPLTWEDVNSINHLLFDIKEDYDNGRLDKEEYYTEVLKRFKAQKGEKL